MKKIIGLALLLTFLPISVFAGSAWMYIKVCNQLNSYGPKGGPLNHNIEYVVKPQGQPYKTENLSATLSPTDFECKDAEIFVGDASSTDPYPLRAELTIMDQQTQVVLWKGFVSKDSDKGDLNFSNQNSEIDDQGQAVFLHYFPGQISVARY